MNLPPLKLTLDPQRDWPEDFELENGCYENICRNCSGHFLGYKRRMVCRLCASSPMLYHFQQRVQPWLMTTFGPEISANVTERNHRFLEESLELVQSLGCTASEAHQLVDYVFNRPLGEPSQEVGGVMTTLAALCLATNLDMHKCGEVELRRIWNMVDKIRAKQAAKPKHSPLPEQPTSTNAEKLQERLSNVLEANTQLSTDAIDDVVPKLAAVFDQLPIDIAFTSNEGLNELLKWAQEIGENDDMWDVGYEFARREVKEKLIAAVVQESKKGSSSYAALYASLRNMHWNDGKLAVIDAKDLKLGVQTYSDGMLDAAIEKARKTSNHPAKD
jgi:hypothetical protein